MEIPPPLITTVFNAVSSHVGKFKDLSIKQKILIVGGPVIAAIAIEAFYRSNQRNIKEQAKTVDETVEATKEIAAEILKLSPSSSHEETKEEETDRPTRETVKKTQAKEAIIPSLSAFPTPDGAIEEMQQKATEVLEFNPLDEVSYELGQVDNDDDLDSLEYVEEETLPEAIERNWYPAIADDDTITNDLILKVNTKLIDFSKEADFKIEDAERYLLHNPPNAHMDEPMKAYLEGQKLTYVGVPSDGDCFYNSICIQLKRLEIDNDVTPKKLRNIVVEEAEKDIDHRNVLISSHKDELIERKICNESDFDPNSKEYSLDTIWNKLKPILTEAVEDYSVDKISQEEREAFKKFWVEHTTLLNNKRDEIRDLLKQYSDETDKNSPTEVTENKIETSLNEYLKLEKTLRSNRLNLQKNFKQPLWGGTDEALLIQRRYPIHFSIIERSSGSTIIKAPLSYDESKLNCRELNLIFLGSHYIPAW